MPGAKISNSARLATAMIRPHLRAVRMVSFMRAQLPEA
jgi:hypothetical protein